MGERKILNKYYPPDFDPAMICRRRTKNQPQMKVRMMLPESIRCATCGNYISRGTKFNSRKEEVVGETYMGIRVYRFYFKCTRCCAEIIFKTNPKDSDYAFESGNFKHNWCGPQDEALSMEKEKQKRVAELEKFDVIKSLENRRLKSKREMDDRAALCELISFKSRLATVSTDTMLEALKHSVHEAKMEELEDEALVRSVFQGSNSRASVKRIHDHKLELAEELEDEVLANFLTPVSSRSENNYTLKRKKVTNRFNNKDIKTPSSFIFKSSSVKVSIVKKPPSESKMIDEGNKTSNGLQWLCQQYESDED